MLSSHKKQKKKKINAYIKEREEKYMVKSSNNTQNRYTYRESFIVFKSNSDDEY